MPSYAHRAPSYWTRSDELLIFLSRGPGTSSPLPKTSGFGRENASKTRFPSRSGSDALSEAVGLQVCRAIAPAFRASKLRWQVMYTASQVNAVLRVQARSAGGYLAEQVCIRTLMPSRRMRGVGKADSVYPSRSSSLYEARIPFLSEHG